MRPWSGILRNQAIKTVIFTHQFFVVLALGVAWVPMAMTATIAMALTNDILENMVCDVMKLELEVLR